MKMSHKRIALSMIHKVRKMVLFHGNPYTSFFVILPPNQQMDVGDNITKKKKKKERKETRTRKCVTLLLEKWLKL